MHSGPRAVRAESARAREREHDDVVCECGAAAVSWRSLYACLDLDGHAILAALATLFANELAAWIQGASLHDADALSACARLASVDGCTQQRTNLGQQTRESGGDRAAPTSTKSVASRRMRRRGTRCPDARPTSQAAVVTHTHGTGRAAEWARGRAWAGSNDNDASPGPPCSGSAALHARLQAIDRCGSRVRHRVGDRRASGRAIRSARDVPRRSRSSGGGGASMKP